MPRFGNFSQLLPHLPPTLPPHIPEAHTRATNRFCTARGTVHNEILGAYYHVLVANIERQFYNVPNPPEWEEPKKHRRSPKSKRGPLRPYIRGLNGLKEPPLEKSRLRNQVVFVNGEESESQGESESESGSGSGSESQGEDQEEEGKGEEQKDGDDGWWGLEELIRMPSQVENAYPDNSGLAGVPFPSMSATDWDLATQFLNSPHTNPYDPNQQDYSTFGFAPDDNITMFLPEAEEGVESAGISPLPTDPAPAGFDQEVWNRAVAVANEMEELGMTSEWDWGWDGWDGGIRVEEPVVASSSNGVKRRRAEDDDGEEGEGEGSGRRKRL